jgi:hypothetical protein
LTAKRSALQEQWAEPSRLLYIEQRLSLVEITKKVPVKLSTLRKWATRGGWNEQRQDLADTPQGHASDVEKMLSVLVSEAWKTIRKTKKVPKGTFDEICKAAKALTALRGDSYFNGHMMQTLELLAEHLRLNGREETAKELAEIIPGFAVWAMHRSRSGKS